MTSPSPESFRRSTVDGLLWSTLDFALRTGFQFAVTIMLARLLTPEDFGLVAIVYVFIGIGWTLAEAGFSAALVQKRDLNDEETCAVFHFQWALALLIALCLGLASSWIARFYGYAVLEPLVQVMALNLFLQALGVVHQSLLSRALAFRKLMIAGSLSSIVGGGLAVLLAIKGAGVWALAAQTLLTTSINVVALWVLYPWRPRLVFRLELLRDTFGFGRFLLLSGLLEVAYGRLYGLFIGKIYGAADLGQYTRASSLQGMPSTLISGIVGRVAFPAFSSIKDDVPRLTAGLRKAALGVMAVNIPVMLGLLAVSEPLVLTLFGDAWRPSIPLFRILCLAGLVWPLHAINGNVLLAMGYSRLFFRIEVFKKTCGVALFIAAIPFGLDALAWSQVLYGVGCWAIHAHYTGRMLGYTAADQLRDCLPWLLAGIVMAGLVWLLHTLLLSSLSVLVVLVAQILLGITVYLGFWIMWDVSMLREATRAVLSRT
jgi:O-antigen/teichoic acid export membrane protein